MLPDKTAHKGLSCDSSNHVASKQYQRRHQGRPPSRRLAPRTRDRRLAPYHGTWCRRGRAAVEADDRLQPLPVRAQESFATFRCSESECASTASQSLTCPLHVPAAMHVAYLLPAMSALKNCNLLKNRFDVELAKKLARIGMEKGINTRPYSYGVPRAASFPASAGIDRRVFIVNSSRVTVGIPHT